MSPRGRPRVIGAGDVSLYSLVQVLSLDVARVLVGLGYGLGYDTDAAAASGSGVGRFAAGFAALAIVGATNATPIVVTTAYPHGVSDRGLGGMSCIISGVLGNTAANNIDADPRSTTIGLHAGILAVPTSALYGQDPTSGAVVALAGNGTYTGGGTIVPAFTDGSILLGRDTIREHSAPPRIVMIPTGSAWGPRSNSMPHNRTAEHRAQTLQRSLRTDMETFSVTCWGQASPPNPARDYDVTKALSHAVEESAHLLFGVPHGIAGGVWDDEKERATQQIKAGHLFTFGISIAVPVLDRALAFAPGGTVIVPTTQMTADGNTEIGCSG